ncbi:MAG: serine hydrolase domain-containing protein [Gemmatimonadaceae bacterium]
MKRFLRWCVVMASLASQAKAQSDSVDAFVRAYIQRHNIPAAAISVVHHGRIVKATGYGVANLELNVPATEHSVFEIGSMSKQISAEAVMMLVEEGKLGLDDPLSQHLTGIPEAWSGIKIRHLLTHTSGLHDWEGDTAFSYRREYTPADFIALVARHPLDFSPGTKFAYTNSAFPLLGIVVEKVSGMPYKRFVTERIFKPAGMIETRFRNQAEVVPNHAAGYVDNNGVFENGEPHRPSILAPNGGVLSTASDMARWNIALSSGTLLKKATAQQMLVPVRFNDGSSFSGGIAWFLDEYRGHHMVLHNGSTVAGFSSVIYRYLDDDLSVVVLLNIDRWNAVNVLAVNVASFYVSGLAMRSLAERPDPDPGLSQRLLTMLGDVADKRDSEMLAPNLRNPGGAVRTNATLGFKAPSARISLLEIEDHGSAGIEHFGTRVRWVYRYRVEGGGRIVYYTIELTPEGKVTRFVPEQG